MSEDEPMFDIEPRRQLREGDRVLVSTIIGDKPAVVVSPVRVEDGTVKVRWVRRTRRGYTLGARDRVDAARVRHDD